MFLLHAIPFALHLQTGFPLPFSSTSRSAVASHRAHCSSSKRVWELFVISDHLFGEKLNKMSKRLMDVAKAEGIQVNEIALEEQAERVDGDMHENRHTFFYTQLCAFPAFGTYDIAQMDRVDSANKHGILLEVVQILTDMNLIITKAYISSDGEWFMDGHQAAQLANMEFLHKERQHIIELLAKIPISGVIDQAL
ncbi:Amino acid binding protein [Stylosanthes scabra]|uniref:ACT domain-containing protein ACR n=1 Tax=Stylosanthes scabra TaxID=79078 RepID=A0ABU6VXA4_9FABA|nr:Amino acid binding protein [Stylosanthes scabra]